MSKIVKELRETNGEFAKSDKVIKDLAASIRCNEILLKAILEVESGGKAYDSQGRLIILTEKHIFHRQLRKKKKSLARAVREGLATRKWSRKNYKGLGGSGSDKRWDKLDAMCNIDETAGLMSASYAKPQIMGFNHKLCGYSSVQEFVTALAQAEEAQDKAFVDFLVNSGLGDELREGDIRAVVRRYNGPGQVERYTGMIQRAMKRLGGKSQVKSNREGTLRLGSSGYRVKALQTRLNELGYRGNVDGDFGPATKRLIVAMQSDNNLTPDGIVGPATEKALETATPINEVVYVNDGEIEPGARQKDTLSDLRARGSKTIKQGDLLKKGAGTVAVGGAVSEVIPIDKLEEASDLVTRVKSAFEPFSNFISDNSVILLVVAGIAVWFIAHKIQTRRLEDHKGWRHIG